MDRQQLRSLMDKADIGRPMLVRLTGFHKDHITRLGRDAPVPRTVQTILEAWFLMDGPKRQELLKAIEGTRPA